MKTPVMMKFFNKKQSLKTAALLALILVCARAGLAAADNSISNQFLTVTFDVTGASFQISLTGNATPVIRDGRIPFMKRPVRADAAARIHDAGFGDGVRVRLIDAAGNQAAIILYDEIPFVFLGTAIGNAAAETAVVQKLPAFVLTAAPFAPDENIHVQGTGFLSTPDRNPGSYVFMAVADKETNRGLVAAWLTQDRGSGVIFAGKIGDSAALFAQIDYGNLRVKPGQSAVGETLVVGFFDDARLGLEQYADLVAAYYNIRLRPVMDGFCTWYSNPYGGASDEAHLKQLAESSRTLLQPYGLDFIQIDDMWQFGERRNGPVKNFYKHNKAYPYPSGMKAAAVDLKKRGFVPGIWWMPFAGDQRDPFFMEHTDWFVKTRDGGPFETPWGGTSLDMTQPGAREYVRKVAVQMVEKWGYNYFKMDGLYTGMAVRQQYVNHAYQWDEMGEAVFHDPDVTNVEAFRGGLRLVRDAVGADVFFLGCTNAQNMRTFGASFGLVDAMRVGEDNGPAWDGEKADLLAGPRSGSNRYFLNGRVWWNDPDPVYIRPSIPDAHARTILSWVGISGQMMTFSDWLPEMPPDRVRMLQRIIPNHGLRSRPVDYFENTIPKIWLLTDNRGPARRDVLGLFGWDPVNAVTIQYDPVRAGLPPSPAYVGFDFWNNAFIAPFKTIEFEIPAGDCRIIAVRPIADHPQVISTNRHITQGIVDIIDEKWENQTLSGVSRVIGGEPYELRIITPQGEKSWTLNKVVTESTVNAKFTQDGPRIRVTIDSAASWDVSWRLEFSQ